MHRQLIPTLALAVALTGCLLGAEVAHADTPVARTTSRATPAARSARAPAAPRMAVADRAAARRAAALRRAARDARLARAAQRRASRGTARRGATRVTTTLPTQAVRGRIAKPQVTFFLARRTPTFRPWIAAGAPGVGARGPRR